MNEQLLSDFKSPKINGIAAKRILANEVLKNIVQGQIEGEGRGVTLGFSTDTSGAQIRILRVLPLTQKARELGSAVNGAFFNSGKEMPQTAEVGIDVITTIDQNIDIPTVAEDMLPIDLLQKTMNNFGDLVNLNINAMTIAEKMRASFLGTNKNVQIIDGTKPEDILPAIYYASSKLDGGDWENGISMFPQNDRIGVIRPAFRPVLIAKGVVIVGGSNYAQEMIAKGVVSPNAKATKLENGYFGDIDGIPFHVASPVIWDLACEYLGLPPKSLNGVEGYISSGIGTGRAIASSEQVKIIDSPDGQGKRLQPLVRMGVKSWYPKSTVVLAVKDFKSPLDIVEAEKTGVVKLVAPGSRVVPTLKVTGSSGANATITVTTGTYQNGGSIGTIASSLKYVISEQDVEPILSNFDALYTKEPTNKGTYTSGTQISKALTGKKYYLYAIAVDNQGTAGITKYLYTNA